VVINTTPLTEREEFWTIQHLGINEVPYKIQNRKVFVESLEALGYALIDDWSQEREFVLPFHEDLPSTLYSGMYFRHQGTH
jgi:putative methyltransferase (TIGR04325 family)